MNQEMQEILDDFELFDEWEDRYAYLIEKGRGLEKLDDNYKTEENKVHGCTSQVWLISSKDGDSFVFKADSDAHIVKGLIALLVKIYSGKTANEISEIQIESFFEQIGLKQHLSPNRSNGFFAMVKKIQDLSHT